MSGEEKRDILKELLEGNTLVENVGWLFIDDGESVRGVKKYTLDLNVLNGVWSRPETFNVFPEVHRRCSV